jgi:hypothetical protein
MIEISGDVIKQIASHGLRAFVDDLKSLLPQDAALYDPDGLTVRMSGQFGDVRFADTYGIMFVSASWEPFEEGAMIPVIKLRELVEAREKASHGHA